MANRRSKRIVAIGRERVGSSPAALAVNGPGDVLVAWDDRTSVRARLVTAGSKVGGEQRLGQGGSRRHTERSGRRRSSSATFARARTAGSLGRR
jgi:hypothetical protein